MKIVYDDAKHKYWLDDVPVPGVTSILGAVVDKPALPWWGMRVGLAAMVRLMQTHGWAELANANSYEEVLSGVPDRGREHYSKKGRNPKPKTLVELLTIAERLSTNHVKEDAGDRGTLIHNAMEQLGTGMAIEDIQSEVPEEHAGYMAGLFSWYLDHEPEFLEQEIIVASRELQYAGRFDCVVRYHAGPHKGKVCLTDLKTSKRVYMTHLVQLDAYELAYEEMKLEPPAWRDSMPTISKSNAWEGFDAKHVVQCGDSGTYQLVESRLPKRSYVPYVRLYQQLQAELAIHKELK